MTPSAEADGTQTRHLTTAELACWREAEELWGVQVHQPQLFVTPQHKSTFAWFRFPPEVCIDLIELEQTGADTELATVFAHEIGHHVLAPATVRAAHKIRFQIRRALVSSGVIDPERDLALLANLWSDMIINNRVHNRQRQRLRPGERTGIVRLWSLLSAASADSEIFWLVKRAYERLWLLPTGSLSGARPTPESAVADAAPEAAEAEAEKTEAGLLRLRNPEDDSALLAATVRSFERDPIRGALSFGTILAPYMLALRDGTGRAGQQATLGAVGCAGPIDLPGLSASDLADILADSRLSEPLAPGEPGGPAGLSDATGGIGPGALQSAPSHGQALGLSEFLALLPAALHDQATTEWYLQQAAPLVRDLEQSSPGIRPTEVIPGPLVPWEMGEDVGDIDWPATIARSPFIIPGATTLQREYSDEPQPETLSPVELDVYIDSSGSMPAPQRSSPALIAGTALILSALAGGGRVRVTSFSSPHMVHSNDRFTTDSREAIASLLTYFGSGTTFPLALYGERYLGPGRARPTGTARHVVVISDDGLTSMFGDGQPGLEHVAAEVRATLDTATLFLLNVRTERDYDWQGYVMEPLGSAELLLPAILRLAKRLRGEPGHGADTRRYR